MVDRVKPFASEDTILGSVNQSDMTEIDPTRVYLAAKGLSLEASNSRLIDLDVSGNIQFTDVTETSPKTVRQLRTANQNLFDNTTGDGFTASTVQAALEELREQTTHISTTRATSLNGTATLVASDRTLQYLTGTATGYSVVLPSATTLTIGRFFNIHNTSTQNVLIKTNGGATLLTLSPSSTAYIYLQTNGVAAGTWAWYQLATSSSGLLTYNLSSATAFATSSTTDVAITGFTLTPLPGTYAIFYNAGVFYTTTPRTHFISIYNGVTKIANSERSLRTAAANLFMNHVTSAVSTFNGTDACTIRVRADAAGGTLTVNDRSIILIRIGP